MKTNEFTYKVMDLNTAQLEIPRETYQRELSPDRVRRIVKAFDERIANEPKVSYRGGHYYVFDGQHTIAARTKCISECRIRMKRFSSHSRPALPQNYPPA